MRRASLAPEALLYAQSSAAAAAASVAARYRCDESALPVEVLLAAAAAVQAYPTVSVAHHQLHHAHQTTSFKPAFSTSSGVGVSSSSMAYTNNRRRSLPVRGHSSGAHSMIVGGQMPAHSRRPVVAPKTRLNTAQHPHVAPIYDPKIQMDDRTLRNLKDTERDSILTGPTFLKSTQSELQSQHRETVVQWMRDVLCEEGSEEEVFPLAVLILDNYLSIENILLRDVQGIAAACMLMASKMKGPAPFNAARLSLFTENSVSPIQIVVAPRALASVFDRLRSILNEATDLDKRTQYMIESAMAILKDKFQAYPAIVEDLDLIDEEDQVTHMMTLEDAIDPENGLNVFKLDPDFETTEAEYEEVRRNVIGDADDSDEESEEGEDEDDADPGTAADQVAKQAEKMDIIDNSEQALVAFRREIYLTIQSSLDFQEAAHKILKMGIKPQLESEQRTYDRMYGMLIERFCRLKKEFQ